MSSGGKKAEPPSGWDSRPDAGTAQLCLQLNDDLKLVALIAFTSLTEVWRGFDPRRRGMGMGPIRGRTGNWLQHLGIGCIVLVLKVHAAVS